MHDYLKKYHHIITIKYYKIKFYYTRNRETALFLCMYPFYVAVEIIFILLVVLTNTVQYRATSAILYNFFVTFIPNKKYVIFINRERNLKRIKKFAKIMLFVKYDKQYYKVLI